MLKTMVGRLQNARPGDLPAPAKFEFLLSTSEWNDRNMMDQGTK